MRRVICGVCSIVLCLLAVTVLDAQQPPASPGPRLVRVTGVFVPASGDPAAEVETLTLALYAEETGGLSLWEETQNVAVDAQGRYAALLGATLPEGLPVEVLGAGEARWLGRTFARPGESEQPRVLLTSVPYALRAADADTLGGRPASAYLLADPGAGGTATEPGAASSDPAAAEVAALTAGTTNFIAKFVNATDLGNSAVYDNGLGRVGVNTTTPLDVVHSRFTDTAGAVTGYAVQNLGGGAASYSGMLFYDQNGALGQFQGFNNLTHEYRINNIASGGSINFMIGSSSKFLVGNNGNVTMSGNLAARKLSGQGPASFTASGTVAVSSTSTTVTGTGTAFLTQVKPGDHIQVGADTRMVATVTTNTSLTTTGFFLSDASGPATILPALLRLDNAAGIGQFTVTDAGNVQIGTTNNGAAKVLISQANRFAGTSITSTINSGNLVVVSSTTQAADVGGVIALGGSRGTTAGGASFAGLRGAKENGTDNDSRGYLGLYTVDEANLFAERARLNSTGNLGVGTQTPGQKVEVNGGVRLNTVTAKPTCDTTVRGTFWVTQQGSGVEDSVEVCVKNAANAFVWRTL